MEYTGELGTYEHGRYVTVLANSPEEAYDKLYAQLKDGEEVVQIRNKYNTFVFDFMNGFELYKERNR